MKKYDRILKILSLAIVCLALLCGGIYNNAGAQVVNKRLYLKGSSGMDRVVPTSASFQSTPALFKQGAVLGVNGNFKTGNGGSTTGSLTSTAFTPAGTNRLLLVSIGSYSASPNPVLTVTFGGVPLVKLTEAVNGVNKVEFWYLRNPSTTSGSIQITWAASVNLEASVGYSCLSNVDQTATFSAPASISGSTAASSLNVSSSAGDLIIDAIAVKDNAITAGAGQTELFSAGTNSVDIRSSWKAAATGGVTQTNLGWSGIAGASVHIGVGIKGLSNDASFTQVPAMCSNFTISGGQTVTIVAHAAVTANTVTGATLPFTASLSYGSTTLLSATTASNTGLGATGSTGTLSWTATLPSDVVIPAGQALTLTLSSDYSAADIRVDFDATNKISYVQLPTSTYINVNSINVYNAAYSSGSTITERAIGETNYIRAVVSDPFGFNDITGMDIRLNGGASLSATSVATSGCTRTYEYVWTPTLAGAYTIQGTAREGTENTVTHSSSVGFTVVRPAVSVAVTKTTPTGPLVVNDTVTYDIAITNTGLSSITTLPLQEIFNAASLQYITASVSPTTTTAGLLTWSNIATVPLAPGAMRNIAISFRILTNANPVNNTARVEGATDNLNYSAAAASNTLAITVANTPDAAIDHYSISGATELDVLSNDRDTDFSGFLSGNAADYNVTILSGPSVGTATVNPSKTIQFAPGIMAEDQLVSFRYKVTEISTGLSDTATVFVRYSAINNPPVVLNDIAVTINDDAVKLAVLANDSDIDGILQTPSVTVTPANGTAVVNADKTITYTPYAGFTGNDVFTYQICDNGTPLPGACVTATATISVGNTTVVCQQSSNSFTVAPVAGAVSYLWTLPAGAVVTSPHSGSLPNPVTTSTSITIDWNSVTPGTYSLCARPTNNCGDGTSQCIDMYVGRVQLGTTFTNVTCLSAKTGSVNLTVSGGNAPYTYVWSGSGGYAASVEDISQLGAGTYSVIVTDKYGCSATTNVIITEPLTSVSVTGTITDENPAGSYTGAVNITPSGGTSSYIYAWSNGAVMEDVSNLAAGTYNVTVSDLNGCSTNRNFTIGAVGGTLTISAINKTDVSCYNGSNGTVNLELYGGTGSYTYAWTGPNSFTASTQDLTSLSAGTYSVTVNDGTSTRNGSITLTQPAAALSAVSFVSNNSCAGSSNGSIGVTVAGGTAPYTYLWSNGAITKDLTGLSAGSYSLVVTDSNGCTTNASGTVTEPTALSVTAVIANSNCTAGNTGALTITPTGGSGPYTFLWSNGAITQNINSLAPGTYSVIITDAAGCKMGRSFVVATTCIGIANTISSTPRNNNDGSYTVTYNIKVENKGTIALRQVRVTNNLATAFAGATSFSVNSISSASFTVNNSFNGTTNINLLSSPLDTLTPGQSKFITVTVTVVPGSMLGVYNNTAIATGLDLNVLSVADSSQNGVNIDPDGDLNPANNNIPTPVTFTESPLIGVAKSLTLAPVNNYDGSYNLTYTITAENKGNVPLRNVQVADDLATTFIGAPVSIISLTSSSLTVNNAYNGTTNTNLLIGTDNMAVDARATIVVTLLVHPNSLSTYNNTAIGTGYGSGGTAATDSSTNGLNSDPDNDNMPANNSTPTPVTFTEAPVIGVAEMLVGTPINLTDGRYGVTYRFIVRNPGNVPLRNVQLTNNLAGTFAGKVITVDSVVTSNGLSGNNAYNGSTDVNLLSSSNTLAMGASDTVTMYFKVIPGTNPGVYNNNVTATANGPLGTATSDISNNGSDVDPENDGPADNSIPTPVSFTEFPQIGLAKSVTTPVNNGDGTYSVTYDIKLINRGNVPLQNVQLLDTLNNTFKGAAFFAVTGTSASGTLSVNAFYDGKSDFHLLAPGGTLPAGASSDIAIHVLVTPGTKLGVYNNAAFVSGTSTGGTLVGDASTDGSVVDPDVDGDPGNNSIVTPLVFVENPGIGIAKRVLGTVVNNGNNTYTFTYEMKVQNTGNVPLDNVQLADDLRQTFPSPATFSVNSLTVHQQPAGSTLNINGSFNGNTNNYLLTGTSSLAVGATGILRLTLTVNPGAMGGPFYNSVNGFATSPAGQYVIDNSQDGVNVDTDNDGNATDNNEPTPVTFNENPMVGLAKSVVSVVDSVNGMNTVTLQLKVKNEGNIELADLKIFDDIVTRFSRVSPANFKAEQGSLFINPAWNGTASSNILAGGQSLVAGDSGNVYITFTVIPVRDTMLTNLATTSGVTITGATISDTSTNGVITDADNSGNTGNDSAPTPVNFILHVPIAVDNSFATPVNTAVNQDVSGNDRTSVDGGNIWALVEPNGGATHGTLTMNANGTFTYAPANNYIGTDVFTYSLCDTDNDCDTAVVTITISTLKDTDNDGIPDEIDIDDDNDGITDYVEVCGNAAITWTCTTGGGDPSKDADQDGIANYKDADWGALNNAGSVASLDADSDGIPDYLDLDSDNDGISDVIESLGADANGDGMVDNYTDTDNDGLSQNVDASNTGEPGSGFGLGAPDFDMDGVPNYLDLDADNDGIPDIVEAFAVDTNNDGRVDVFIDTDEDGLTDANDGDTNGDGTIDNFVNVAVYSNVDGNGDGKADSYPYRANSDNSGLPNFIDLDSDGDGITDATESGISTASYDKGMTLGCTLVNGWCNLVDALPALGLTNTDAMGRVDVYDIDSDNDGITDNIESQSTSSYGVPNTADGDGDGVMNAYDIFNGIGANGLTPYDHDYDGIPDYLDPDADNDGAPDRAEGDKKNVGLAQASIDASGDSDSDGLMNIFDIFDISAVTDGITYMNVSMSNMGSGGNYDGPVPGSSSVALVKSSNAAADRDWRSVSLLPLNVVKLSGTSQNEVVRLVWKVENEKSPDHYVLNKSRDGVHFSPLATVKAVNSSAPYEYNDDLKGAGAKRVFYKVEEVKADGTRVYSNVISLQLLQNSVRIKLYPNPVVTHIIIVLHSGKVQTADLTTYDAGGKIVLQQKNQLTQGENKIVMDDLIGITPGSYVLKVQTSEISYSERFIRQ